MADKVFNGVILREISMGQQSCEYHELIVVTVGKKKHKLRIYIVSDAYAFQSSANISLWSPTEGKWNHVESIHHGLMRTPEGLKSSHYAQDKRYELFKADRDSLLNLAKEII